MIKVLVVDDSAVAREYLTHIINGHPGMRVTGTARNGREALDFIDRQRPDVITMDINMPDMNGFEATRAILEHRAIPIIIVTANWNAADVETTFLALEAGALTVLERPAGIGHPDYAATTAELLRMIRLMSEVKVIRRFSKQPANMRNKRQFSLRLGDHVREIKIVALGASTGGPAVLKTIFSNLPSSFSVPIVAVQHISQGFLAGLIEWLGKTTFIPVRIAAHGEYALPGHIYFAPDGAQLEVTNDCRLTLKPGVLENNLCPSISCLFRSVARSFREKAVGILLTGMGKDGAQELKLMKDGGALTIVQDEESSVVYGMPGEAAANGGASLILNPEQIAETLSGVMAAHSRNGESLE